MRVLWRRLQPSQHVDDGQLSNKLAVPWQYQTEPINDLLGHVVVAHIPTDFAVQCFGHDIVNSKDHAVRCVSREPGAAPARYQKRAALLPAVGLDRVRAGHCLGVWGDNAPR